METKREEELVITPHPVDHMLKRGHKDPAIREFVNKYLRQMEYKREDAKENMEEERLKRLKYLDQAGIYAADERIESLETNDDYVRGEYLDARRGALVRAQGQTYALLNLFNVSKNLRLTMRGLNSFLNAIMEGRIAHGQESFSDFLINLVHDFPGIDAEYLRTLELYIALSYGDRTTRRNVLFDIADASGLFREDVEEIRPRLEARVRWENLTKEQESCGGSVLQSLSLAHTYKGKEGTGIKPKRQPYEVFDDYRLEEEARNPDIAGRKDEQIILQNCWNEYKWSAYAFCVDFALFILDPRLREMLKPYLTSKFEQYFHDTFLDVRFTPVTEVVRLIEKADAGWDIARKYTGAMFAKECAQFVRRCDEGAFVVLCLMASARYMYQNKKEHRKRKAWPPFYPESAGLSGKYDIHPLLDQICETVLDMPDYLSARTLSEYESGIVRETCIRQLHKASDATKKAIATIDEFAAFCKLLSQPDNHILVPSGQYTVKQVPARLEHDVENQKARELMELPKYTAFTKMHQGADGTQTVWKGKIQTLKLPPGPEDYLTREVVKTRRLCIDVQSTEYLKWRDRIAEEIAKRQEKWRRRVAQEPPATQSESKAEIVNIAQLRKRAPFRFSFEDILWVPKEPVVVPEDEPPPSHS